MSGARAKSVAAAWVQFVEPWQRPGAKVLVYAKVIQPINRLVKRIRPTRRRAVLSPDGGVGLFGTRSRNGFEHGGWHVAMLLLRRCVAGNVGNVAP